MFYPAGYVLEKNTYQIKFSRPPDSWERNNKLSERGTVLSQKSKTKIKGICNWLFGSQKNNFQWITLTLPPSKIKACDTLTHTEHEVFMTDSWYNQRLSMYLENLKKVWGFDRYVWVAEIQNKNGRGAIHYHIIADAPYLEVQHLNNYWCQLLQDYHEYSGNAIERETLKYYYAKSADDNAGLKDYLTKYVQKNESCVYARVWGSSRGLSRVNKGYLMEDEHTGEVLLEIDDFSEKNLLTKTVPNTNINYRIASLSSRQFLHAIQNLSK